MAPRPKKPRHCCAHRRPEDLVFKPAGTPLSELAKIDLEVDELEALRYCDLDGLTQEQAGEQMGVSRGTIQRLVTSGRKKLVEALLLGKALMIRSEQ